MGNQSISQRAEAAKVDSTAKPNQADAAGVSMTTEKAMEQAHKLYSTGRLAQASKICSEIVAQRPRMAEAHNLMGAILNAQGESAAAVKSLQRAIHLNGNNAQFYSNLGEIERRRGKLPEALVALRRATTLTPNRPRRGTILASCGMTAASLGKP